jgi:quinolinate synthase
MAETAAILAAPGQKVFIPDARASCVMSEMAPGGLAEKIALKLRATGRKPDPLTYVNSSGRVKALCGDLGGSVCTSANAATMLTWALGQGRASFFCPTRMLGENTCDPAWASPPKKRQILDIRREGRSLIRGPPRRPRCFCGRAAASCIPGSRAGHIRTAGPPHPGALVAVHPECPPPDRARADAAGSTSS